MIRSNFEDSELTAPVSGRVVKCFLSQNNQSIQKGDTLLVITTELLNTQQQLVNTQQQDYNAQLQDLTALVSPKDIGFIHPSQNVRFQIDTYLTVLMIGLTLILHRFFLLLALYHRRISYQLMCFT